MAKSLRSYSGLLFGWALIWILGVPAVMAQAPSELELETLVQDELPLSQLAQRLRDLEASQQRLEGLVTPQTEPEFPGAARRRDYEPLPDYVYEQSYYDRQGLGARPIADYAPEGYEARDQQEGPAEPAFERLYAPEPLTAADQDRYVTRGLYPGSFLVPGTSTSVRLRGFVRLAGLFDFDPIGVPDAFVTNSIPVPQETGQNFNMSGRISRFALETWTPTSFSDWNVHTYIEGDFFNGLGQAAGGGGNPFRLRHAFFDFGYFRFGQQNTVFMDASSWPSLVDFQGPNSWANQRQPSARATLPIGDRMYWASSIERPFSDITTVDPDNVRLGSNVQDVPDFATHWRYQGNRGHLQLAGLLRTIGYRPTGGQVERQTAGGISGNVVIHPWAVFLGTDPVEDEDPSGWTRSRILLQGTRGPGVGRYLNDLAGQGLDGQIDPVTGELELADAIGWTGSYEHWFDEHWLMNFTYAQVDVDDQASQRAETYDGAKYVASSLWWIPIPRLSFAVEFMAGERENLDGQTADVQRLHGLAQYNF